MGIFWQIQLESKFVQYPRVFLIRVLPELILQLTFIAFLSFCQIFCFYLFVRFVSPELKDWGLILHPVASSSSIVEFACPINSPCCNYPLKYLSKRSLPQGGRGINLNGPSGTLQDISNFDDSRNRIFCQNIWFNESIVEILRYYQNLFDNVALGRCSTLLWGHRAWARGRWGGHLSMIEEVKLDSW